MHPCSLVHVLVGYVIPRATPQGARRWHVRSSNLCVVHFHINHRTNETSSMMRHAPHAHGIADVPNIGDIPVNDAHDGPLLPDDVGVVIKDDNSLKVTMPTSQCLCLCVSLICMDIHIFKPISQ
jgi:hypothetical protein